MKRAFTLMEMTVVLVVVGLLVGGLVCVGDRRHHTVLETVRGDEQRYIVAVRNFRAAYHTLPGDTPNATQYFTSAGGNGHNAACYKVASICHPAPTCDGNGDGRIGGDTASANETLRFWQHLSSADIIPGNFIGTVATNFGETQPYVAGLTSPKAAVAETYWLAGYAGVRDGNSLWLAQGGDATPFKMVPADAYAIDRKFDDGWPDTGDIVAARGTAAAPCVVATANGPAFSTNIAGKSCSIAFAHAF